ncbi:MAG: hypothetical protein IK008_01775 [Bacteroidales bacterium]|nr:hypothetical protein [Bacteroidales bacterium]
MKLNKTIILAGAALIVAASCGRLNQVPVWSDADNFVAFDKAKISVSEDGGQVRIPVTVASINPVETEIAYSVDAENEKCTAVEGTDFTLVDPFAKLSFDGTARTAYIELNILPIHGTDGYTGDKSIIIKLDNATNGVNLGFGKSCEVVINDQDHPLASILGEYTITDVSGGSGTITIEKDPDDITVVHFPDICIGLINWIGDPDCLDIIGQVSADLQKIVIPVPVDTGYKYSGIPIMVYACTPTDIMYDVASVTLTQTEPGKWSSGDYGLWGYIRGVGANSDWGYDPFTLVKK